MAPVLPLITTIREQCRVCYTCVRECPAKAIRISSGQAEVIPERCIGCGNCVKVCSQKAKQILDSTARVKSLLASGGQIAAMIAPSFPAEFKDFDPEAIPGMIRSLGFSLVAEVGFGADLVADRYSRLLSENPGGKFIAANCPAVVEFIERYHPGLTPSIAPIVSPMLAAARALRAIHGEKLPVVFIGPCIAKKAERTPELDRPEIDAVLTFVELRALFGEMGIEPGKSGVSNFDPPHARAGALFPISRGMLQAADIGEDLMTCDVVAADGRRDFVEAIKEFESGDLDARLLEVLACNGCIMGPGMSTHLPLFSRRSLVAKYVRERSGRAGYGEWKGWIDRFQGLDLSRRFDPNDVRLMEPPGEKIAEIMLRMGKHSAKDELNCGACGYETCREHAAAIHLGLAETEMCLPHAIEQLRSAMADLAESHRQLAGAQEALVQSEKLASMGQLAAGIAHEINNPLGVVLMYSHLLLDDNKDNPALKKDLEMIAGQTDRCKKIVAGLLNFARQNKVARRPANLAELSARSLDLVSAPENVRAEVITETDDPSAEIDGDQISQVLVNLIHNAYDAMPAGGSLRVVVGGDPDRVTVRVEDTGSGIPPENISRMFEPFFTTKPLGRGTGLGLAVAYGIIKMHGGDIRAKSNNLPERGPTGSSFLITLPRVGPGAAPPGGGT